MVFKDPAYTAHAERSSLVSFRQEVPNDVLLDTAFLNGASWSGLGTILLRGDFQSS